MSKPVVFGVETDFSKNTLNYMRDTRKRFKKEDPLKNPYSQARSRWRPQKKNNLYVFSLTPFYPELYLWSWIPALVVFLPVWAWLKVVGLLFAGLMFSTALFWSSELTFKVMRIGAKKAGCDVKMWRLLSPSECVERLL